MDLWSPGLDQEQSRHGSPWCTSLVWRCWGRPCPESGDTPGRSMARVTHPPTPELDGEPRRSLSPWCLRNWQPECWQNRTRTYSGPGVGWEQGLKGISPPTWAGGGGSGLSKGPCQLLLPWAWVETVRGCRLWPWSRMEPTCRPTWAAPCTLSVALLPAQVPHPQGPLTVLSLGCCCWSCFIMMLRFLSLHRLFWNQTRITRGLRPVISTSCSFMSASGRGLAA